MSHKFFNFNKSRMPPDEERQTNIKQSFKISPEEVALFGSMLASLNRLAEFGI